MKKRGGEGLSRDLSVREEMKSKHGAKMDLRVSVHVHDVHVECVAYSVIHRSVHVQYL